MHLDIEGVPVLFPFDYVYPEQLKYMRELKYAIENKGNSLKTVIISGFYSMVYKIFFFWRHNSKFNKDLRWGYFLYCEKKGFNFAKNQRPFRRRIRISTYF